MNTYDTPNRRTFVLGTAAALLAAGCTGSAADPVSESAAPTKVPEATATSAPSVSAPSVSAPTTSSPDENAPDQTSDIPEPIEAAPAPVEVGLRQLDTAQFDELAVCALTPSATAGPFPSRRLLERVNIHENYPGHPLRLGLRVVDSDCAPVPGAAVDIWHCDATGDYSSYDDSGSGKDEGEGSTFCRGFQVANADGIVEFQTIYPGWYEGRAVHVHVTVHIDDDHVLTTQLYFDEAITASVYATGEYAQFGLPDTTWAQDRFSGNPVADGTGFSLSAAETHGGSGTLGLANLGVAV